MINENLSPFEIFSIVYVVSGKKKGLTKEQVILIHYLSKNPHLNQGKFNNLERYNKLQIFNICDYDSIINCLALNELISIITKRGKFKIRITKKGKKLFDENILPYFSEYLKNLGDITSYPIDRKNLKNRVIPFVNIKGGISNEN